MGLLSAIFGGAGDKQRACVHERLSPRWRGPEVMSDDAGAMGWVCQDCGREFLGYLVQDRRPRER